MASAQAIARPFETGAPPTSAAALPATAVREVDGRSYVIDPVVGRRGRVLIYGNGHVASALAYALAPLDFAVTAVADIFEGGRLVDMPAGIARINPYGDCRDGLASAVTYAGAADAGAVHLVMTHSHTLDFEICDALLRRGDFAFLGLIGSATKRARFVQRFRRNGIDDVMLDRLVCPIGIAGIHGKEPAVIAVAVAAQLLALHPSA